MKETAFAISMQRAKNQRFIKIKFTNYQFCKKANIIYKTSKACLHCKEIRLQHKQALSEYRTHTALNAVYT